MRMIQCAGLLIAAGLLAGQESPLSSENVVPVHFEPISYPLAARFGHVSGVVVVRLHLDDEGHPVSAEAIYGDAKLTGDCISNAKKWQFRPNREHAAVIVYDFRIEGLCQMPCPGQFQFRPPNLAIITLGDPVVDHH